MRHPEFELQCACVAWFRIAYRGRLIYHIPNGERRDAITGARLKRSGVVAGVPDLCVPYSNGTHSHLYIEMKAGKAGRLSPNQQAIIGELQRGGAAVAVCHSFDEFREAVDAYFAPISAKK